MIEPVPYYKVFDPTIIQYAMYSDPSRFIVGITGRRCGKSYLGTRKLLLKALAHDKDTTGDYWYVGPTIGQAREIAWDELCEISEPYQVKDPNSTRMEIRVHIAVGGVSKIRVTGAEKYNNLRGKKLDYLVLDEFAFIHRAAFEVVLAPMLATTDGGAMLLSTPYPGWSQEYLEMALSGEPDWSGHHYWTIQGEQVKRSELDFWRKRLSPRDFRQEYEASFEHPEGQVYSEFNRELHVSDDLLLPDQTDTLHIGIDFNVNPLCAVVATFDGREIHVVDEIKLTDAYTENLCHEIRRRYPDHNICVYPDSSGANRHTNSVETDHDILQRPEFGFDLYAFDKNPEVRSRIQHVQKLLSPRSNHVELKIHTECVEVIKCLTGQVYNKSGEPDKSKKNGFDHMNDGLGYMCMHVIPFTDPHSHIQMPTDLFTNSLPPHLRHLA